MKMLREYFNNRAAIWDETAAEKDAAKLEQMAKRLELEPGSTLLDVGTGTGVFLSFLLSRIGVDGQIIALDIAEEMLKKAIAKGFDGNIAYLQADIMDIPLCDEIFDCVVCYSSFPHFRDKSKALAEIKRVLKSGGRLLICHTSSRAEINMVHQQIGAVKNDLLPGADEMELLLSAAGFDGVNIEDDSRNYLASARKPA